MSLKNTQDVKRLINTLYPYFSKNPIVSKLHDSSNPELLIDKIPLSKAISLLPSQKTISNILYCPITHPNLSHSDFLNIKTTSRFLPSISNVPYKFQTVQSRDSKTLLPLGGYYLIFQDVVQAAAYLLDNNNVSKYGNNFTFQMVKYPYENLLHEKLDENGVLLKDIDVEVLKINNINRQKFIILENFPNDKLEKMLWNYSLDYKNEPISFDDSWLVKLKNIQSAQRLKRDWNGKIFNGQLKKVKVSIMN